MVDDFDQYKVPPSITGTLDNLSKGKARIVALIEQHHSDPQTIVADVAAMESMRRANPGKNLAFFDESPPQQGGVNYQAQVNKYLKTGNETDMPDVPASSGMPTLLRAAHKNNFSYFLIDDEQARKPGDDAGRQYAEFDHANGAVLNNKQHPDYANTMAQKQQLQANYNDLATRSIQPRNETMSTRMGSIMNGKNTEEVYRESARGRFDKGIVSGGAGHWTGQNDMDEKLEKKVGKVATVELFNSGDEPAVVLKPDGYYKTSNTDKPDITINTNAIKKEEPPAVQPDKVNEGANGQEGANLSNQFPDHVKAMALNAVDSTAKASYTGGGKEGANGTAVPMPVLSSVAPMADKGASVA